MKTKNRNIFIFPHWQLIVNKQQILKFKHKKFLYFNEQQKNKIWQYQGNFLGQY